MTEHSHSIGRGQSGGFTLIELMIAVVVVAILVGIAVPSYTTQVRKSRRTEARNALLDIAAREERFLSVQNNYTALPAQVGYTAAAGWPVVVGSGYYQIDVQLPTPTSFIATATAIGAQANDATCAVLSVNEIGQQTATTMPDCWGN
jgi:type IV pilus assembly protein PilE